MPVSRLNPARWSRASSRPEPHPTSRIASSSPVPVRASQSIRRTRAPNRRRRVRRTIPEPQARPESGQQTEPGRPRTNRRARLGRRVVVGRVETLELDLVGKRRDLEAAAREAFDVVEGFARPDHPLPRRECGSRRAAADSARPRGSRRRTGAHRRASCPLADSPSSPGQAGISPTGYDPPDPRGAGRGRLPAIRDCSESGRRRAAGVPPPASGRESRPIGRARPRSRSDPDGTRSARRDPPRAPLRERAGSASCVAPPGYPGARPDRRAAAAYP